MKSEKQQFWIPANIIQWGSSQVSVSDRRVYFARESSLLELENIYGNKTSLWSDLHQEGCAPVQVYPEPEDLLKQVESLNKLIDTKNTQKEQIVKELISVRQSKNDDLLDILFDLYGKGLLSISEVKKIGEINQYDFVYMLAERGMNFVYPEEDEKSKNDRLKRARELL